MGLGDEAGVRGGGGGGWGEGGRCNIQGDGRKFLGH